VGGRALLVVIGKRLERGAQVGIVSMTDSQRKVAEVGIGRGLGPILLWCGGCLHARLHVAIQFIKLGHLVEQSILQVSLGLI
jgi:hypothetical protein